ncbi:unnamed protein product [Adineta ricciae]|uniref:Uncharacterized protein n=1 Tax=Adineta ricciae TaxID=249248 RepID=A0A815X4U2_ADIRI|nr:unnamed protein product [Adineta ricciae]
MASNHKPTQNDLHKQEPFIENNMDFQNDGNSEPMQVNVHINTTININLLRNIVRSDDHNNRTKNMNVNIKNIKIQENIDNYGRNNTKDEVEDEETIEIEYYRRAPSQKHHHAQ